MIDDVNEPFYLGLVKGVCLYTVTVQWFKYSKLPNKEYYGYGTYNLMFSDKEKKEPVLDQIHINTIVCDFQGLTGTNKLPKAVLEILNNNEYIDRKTRDYEEI
jgi:hypothetical protein